MSKIDQQTVAFAFYQFSLLSSFVFFVSFVVNLFVFSSKREEKKLTTKNTKQKQIEIHRTIRSYSICG